MAIANIQDGVYFLGFTYCTPVLDCPCFDYKRDQSLDVKDVL